MSDTPRTDAAIADRGVVLVDFTRSLERELRQSKWLAYEMAQELALKCSDPIHVEQVKKLAKELK
jgi:hypothetical protein